MVTLSKGGSITGFVQNQGTLELAVRDLFPKENIEVNVRKALNTRSPFTGSFLEFDVWVPKFNLCFEFQDPYHYITTWETNLTLDYIKSRDNIKQGLARANGDTLVTVPCWWDGSKGTLADSITFQRPDIIFAGIKFLDEYIPLNPPSSLFLSFEIPVVGELMLASFPPVHFKRSISAENPWWMGEKYDGIRACWSPRLKQVYSRNATLFQLPEPHYTLFSDCFMDGELWFGRGYFADSQKLAYSSAMTNWQLLRFMIFDNPDPSINDLPFEKRYETLLPYATPTYFINLAFRMLCKGGKQLTNVLKDLLEGEGEGVIMRKPKSLYEHGRSGNLIKLKAVRGDREGLVIKYNAPDNSYIIRLPEGMQLTVKAAEEERQKQQYKEGDLVTFSYEGVTRHGQPINPQLIRVRRDLSWQQVLASSESGSKSKSLNDLSLKLVGTQGTAAHTRANKKQSLRYFYEKIAKDLQLDPRDPSTWYNLSRNTILAYKGGASALVYYDGSMSRSFIDLFPELELEENKFSVAPHNYWGAISNRRKFFVEYAAQYGFDPLLAENWHTRMDDLKFYKGGESVRTLYNGSFAKALFHAFPEVEFNETQFTMKTPYGTDTKNMRLFFETLARDNAFEPLIPSNWYSVSRNTIIAQKLGRSILGLYDNNISKAIIENFPEIGLQESKFLPEPNEHWKEVKNRRIFFEEFALSRGMDYKLPETWYSIPPSDFTTNRNASQILKFYSGNSSKALIHLFSDIDLDLSKFPKQAMYWRYDENKRKFFEKFAQQHNFDPLIAENWYNISALDIKNSKGGKGVRLLEKGGFVSTLCSVFPEVIFDKLRFKTVPVGYFKNFENRRAVLTRYAEEQQFDPLCADNWYNVRSKAIEAAKGGKALMDHYGYRLRNAILDLFPDVSFDNSKFLLAKSHWNNQENQRSFFEKYAKKQGFDPLHAENWYSVTYESVYKSKGAGLLYKYRGNLGKAIMAQFPDIGLTQTGFNRGVAYWKSPENRRNFFIQFARRRNFDPNLRQNWSVEIIERLKEEKSFSKVLKHHSSIDQALVDLFCF